MECESCKKQMTCVIGNFWVCKSDECEQERTTVPDLDPAEWDRDVTTVELPTLPFDVTDIPGAWPGFVTFAGVWSWQDESELVFGAATSQPEDAQSSSSANSSPNEDR